MAVTKDDIRKIKKARTDREYRLKNIERLKEYDRWRHRTSEARRETGRKSKLKNREKVLARDRARNKVRRITHAAYYRAKTIERRNPQRTPPWQDLAPIQELYRQAKPLGMQVDHIVPLRGKDVCGLNVTANLQLLTPQQNNSKKNKFSNEEYQEWRKNGQDRPFLPK